MQLHWTLYRCISPSPGKKPRLAKDDLVYKLRWVTLGYHYDWNTKVPVNALTVDLL